MTARPDPVKLEIFRNLFVSLCEEMGIALMRTGCSPNIKERRDYSCAVFDAAGRTIAQGDHMPVHLGSMPASVAAAIEAWSAPGAGGPEPGDVILLNDPFRGGTHLPDITVVSPLFVTGRTAGGAVIPARAARRKGRPARSAEPAFYLANRAHHADVGGMTPGSMPLATDIHQEGMILPPVRIVRGGAIDRDLLSVITANCRTPGERDGDLRAQFASLRTGEKRLLELIDRYGVGEVTDYAGHLQRYSGRLVRATIRKIPDGVYRFEDWLDDDGAGTGPIRLSVTLTIRGERAIVDLRDCDGQVRGGVNAVASITTSAVYYVFRCLLARGVLGGTGGSEAGEVPWNAGGFEPIEILLRPGSVLAARSPAAVAGGNVETSQRVVDLLLGAFARALPGRVPAASQGTMNNIGLGGVDPRDGSVFAYYETIAGGMGGRPGGRGWSGVHTHMTNSLNTPVEALETAIPVRVEGYTLRRGSGGAGKHPGGEGVTRRLRLLVPARVSLLTERRVLAPWGVEGGSPGRRGRNLLKHADGSGAVAGRGGGHSNGTRRMRKLPGKTNLDLSAGDLLVIETPGGGGWGAGRSGSKRSKRGGRKR